MPILQLPYIPKTAPCNWEGELLLPAADLQNHLLASLMLNEQAKESIYRAKHLYHKTGGRRFRVERQYIDNRHIQHILFGVCLLLVI